jgi:hypothetical protein
MRHLTAAADHLSQAQGLPGLLDAACDAFEAILTAIGGYEDTTATATATTALSVPHLLAATQAANGRDAVLFAPSLPPRARHSPPQASQEQERGSAAGISAVVADLSRLTATRLTRAATLAAAADRAACHNAAHYARQIHHLLTGDGP